MDYKYIPFYVQGNAVTGMYYGQWGMAEDRDIEYVKEMYPLTFMTIQEMGAAAVMANTAIATAGNVPAMAEAFKKAIEAGRSAYLTGMGRVLARGGSASDPLTGFLR